MVTLSPLTAVDLMPLDLGPLPENPLVSVLVSNYNYARYIGETIQSVLDQSYANFELLVCDDGSTDDSVSVIEQFQQKDPRVHLIRKVNGGQASGFNTAFAASHGQILAFLDSDDVCLPAKLAKIVASFQRHPDSGFGVHRVIRVNEARRRQGVWPLSGELPKGWYGPRLLQDGGILPFTPPTSGLSLRREVGLRIFPLPLDAKPACADHLITRFAPFLTRVTREDEALAEYRLHTSNNYEPKRVTAASIQRELLVSDALWVAQKRFLGSIDPQLAEIFQPLGSNPHILYLKYIHSRLGGSFDARQCYNRYMASRAASSASRLEWFWKTSIFMPRFVFDFSINLLNRQSWLKQMISRSRRMS
jgi:Glycosyl transferase family 2